MRAMTSASQAWGSMSLSLAVTISEYMNAARWPPRSEPTNSHDFLPRAILRIPIESRSIRATVTASF
jgi:hypothetical protein